ncbi:hypothetical protein A2U01_0077549, partial [Trifolium medium]|nr:hypothetical protein [Trifolium medium]
KRAAILDLSYPSLFAVVEKVVELVLQIRQCNISVNPEKIRFPVIEVDCS